jgi:hypothetical protein
MLALCLRLEGKGEAQRGKELSGGAKEPHRQTSSIQAAQPSESLSAAVTVKICGEMVTALLKATAEALRV